MGLLEYAARTIPMGTAYAVWAGIGAVGTVIAVGIALLQDEPEAPAPATYESRGTDTARETDTAQVMAAPLPRVRRRRDVPP